MWRLRPLTRLPPVVAAPGSAHARTGNRLAVYDGDRGTGVASRFDARRAPERIGKTLPKARLDPLAEVVVNGLPRGKARRAFRQEAPLAAGLVVVENGVHKFAGMMLTEGLPLEEGIDKFPLGIRQIGAIASLHGSDRSC